MAAFQYDAPDYSRLVPTIADLIARRNDTAAQLAAQRGAIWGRTFQELGQIPAQIEASKAAAQERTLKSQEIAARTASLQDQDQQRKLANLKRVALSVGSLAKGAGSPEDFSARIDDQVALGALPKEFAAQIKSNLAGAGSDGWGDLQKRYVDFGAQFADNVKLGKDEEIINPVSENVVASGPKGAPTATELALQATGGDAAAAFNRMHPPQQPTEWSTLLNAAGGDPNKALELARQQRNPPSLEDQYLKAKADGNESAAQLILNTWKDKAAASRDPVATAQLEAIRSLTQREAQARLDEKDVTSDKNQQKFEQEYRTVLQRGLSSRSGGLGLEDAKVQQANHLLALMDQSYDPKTGAYNIPKVQYQELALGLARLVSPGGQVGEGMKNDLIQATAEGDLLKVATYLTGKPFNGSTQDVYKMLRDSIERQGSVAEQNRENEMRYLRGLAPTDLSESRRTALEANSLGALRQSKILTNDKGERRMVVSTDGGKTWK